jgi:hypothetical protein
MDAGMAQPTHPTSHERLIREYLGALDLCSVAIVTVTGGAPIRLVIGGRFRRDWQAAATVWTASDDQGRALVDACRLMWRGMGVTRVGEWFELEPTTALGSVRTIAEEIDVPLRNQTEIQVFAAVAVECVEAELARMHAARSLKARLEMVRAIAVAARPEDLLGFGQSQKHTS